MTTKLKSLSMMTIMIFSPTILVHANDTTEAAHSQYTTLNLDACQVLKTYEESGGVDLRCDGFKDVPVYVSEGDLRFYVSYGERSDVPAQFAPFNTLGKKVEWRLDEDGQPVAAIVRHHLDISAGAEDDDSPKERQVLSISSIGTKEKPGCVIGMVNASTNPNANQLARQIADHYARAFRCGVDEAGYVGLE